MFILLMKLNIDILKNILSEFIVMTGLHLFRIIFCSTFHFEKKMDKKPLKFYVHSVLNSNFLSISERECTMIIIHV
jgi:hypothetical protein